ncbi:unnamed protein product [Sphenostylis stenocarpa]|uniref:Uncharacterized protein n=1 Tax=Sphenostylis stenocarpa TaxID=92480 RepID=A0AA86VFU4_9FABA|nr:unnamed protein product [Sphenostylis stenocarpa]
MAVDDSPNRNDDRRNSMLEKQGTCKILGSEMSHNLCTCSPSPTRVPLLTNCVYHFMSYYNPGNTGRDTHTVLIFELMVINMWSLLHDQIAEDTEKEGKDNAGLSIVCGFVELASNLLARPAIRSERKPMNKLKPKRGFGDDTIKAGCENA